MARKMKDDASAKPKAKAGHNGFDPAVLSSIVERIEGVFVDLDSERGSYMKKCQSLREDISNLYDEAKARGIPPKPLKKAVKARELNRKIEALRADLEDMVDQESYDQIRQCLGDLADTPLGEAALKGKESNGETDVRPGFLRKDETAERVASNVTALKGIKQLPDTQPPAA